jgi:rod shape-determining protein MreD
MLMFYLILAFLLFFLQNLLTLPSRLHLDLLTLFVIFISLRASFMAAVILAIILGIALDCYGMAPLGLQAGGFLVTVVGVEILRRHLNFLYIFPQIVGVAALALLQALTMALLLHLLMPVQVIYPALVQQGLWHIGVTALAAPIVLALFGWLERVWRRWFFIKP